MPERVRITGDLYHPVVPDGAINVTRNSRWGNPHPVGRPCKVCGNVIHTRTEAVRLHRNELLAGRGRVTVDDVRRDLAGHDLACWCKPDEACHGDTLLAIANEEHT